MTSSQIHKIDKVVSFNKIFQKTTEMVPLNIKIGLNLNSLGAKAFQHKRRESPRKEFVFLYLWS